MASQSLDGFWAPAASESISPLRRCSRSDSSPVNQSNLLSSHSFCAASVLDQFGRPCARVKEISLDERLNAARQVRHKIYKNALSHSIEHFITRNVFIARDQREQLALMRAVCSNCTHVKRRVSRFLSLREFETHAVWESSAGADLSRAGSLPCPRPACVPMDETLSDDDMTRRV